MEDESRVRRKRKKRKKKSTFKKILVTLLVVLLIIVGAGVFVAWRVYSDVQSSTDEMYEEVQHEQKREKPVEVDNGEDPFSILLMGIDTGALGRTETGRSDTLMLMTVNPNTEQTTLVSIPRDTYTEIVGHGTSDKINHAYAFGGTEMTMNTVQNLFDIPVDYFVSVNMEGLEQIVDAVGGIDITPQLTFDYEGGYSFTKGQTIHMDGETALAYSRMRYDDPNGDYGRQERQREVVLTTVKKMASVESAMNYKGVLNSLSSNMQTNLTFDEMVDAFTKYNSAVNNMEQVQMSGTGRIENKVYYEFIPDEEVQRVSGILKSELEL